MQVDFKFALTWKFGGAFAVRIPVAIFNGREIAMRSKFAVGLSLLLSFATSASLFGADPNLSVIVPRGVQRGTEQVLRFAGARLDDAQ